MSAAIQAIRVTGSSRRYSCGQEVFQEGDEGDTAFIIEQGAVEIWSERGGERLVLALLEAGELFGEMTVLEGIPRTASATAVGDTVLTVVTNEQLMNRMEAADPVVRLIVDVLSDRLRSSRLTGSVPARSTTGLRAIAKMRMESALQHALACDDFQLFYQPIVDLRTRRTVGVEALLRWNHPTLGRVNPQEIISLAEETNLIIAIDQWVVSRAIRDLALLPESMFVTINLSGQEIGRVEIIDQIDGLVAETGVSEGRIKLEVTEGVVVHADAALPWIAQCQARGYPVVLDDFGTGYSSLSYLLKLSVSTLKIDRSFVLEMARGERAASIVEAILGMAGTLGMTVVAEGIESMEMADRLHALGCLLGQGYGFARPMPLAELLVYCADQGMK